MNQEQLIGHLKDIKSLLTRIAIVVLVASVVCYNKIDKILGFLIKPLAETFGSNSDHRRLIFTSLPEAFVQKMYLAGLSGFFFSFPLICFFIYRYLAPALYKKERNTFTPLFLLSPLLFYIGSALAYYLVFPLAFKFFISFESVNSVDIPIILEARLASYLSMCKSLIVAFGVAFQLPIALFLMVKMGVASRQGLKSFRRYMVVVIAVIAAVLTPPDVISQVCLMVPLYLLYEAAILFSRDSEKTQDPATSDNCATGV
jgi:sec-independent protein translocase protein TatC